VRPFVILLLYIMATVLLGALLAPPLYWLGQWAVAHGTMRFLAETEFGKFFNRAVLVSAVALLWPAARCLGVGGWRSLGLDPDRRRWKRLGAGFLASFLVMMALGAGLLFTGVYRLKGDLPWGALGKIALTATAVSCIEEWLFRGAILGLIRQTITRWWAVCATSALYSLVHFLKPPDDLAEPVRVEWSSGLALVPELFWQFREPMLLLGGFSTLFLVGWILGFATVRTRSLWMAIGLHAGWIFGTMGFSKFTKRVIKDTLPWFGSDLTVGLGSVAMVLITGGIIWWWLGPSHVERGNHPGA
jgi:membrane protease YdiL (CAAX protease family)